MHNGQWQLKMVEGSNKSWKGNKLSIIPVQRMIERALEEIIKMRHHLRSFNKNEYFGVRGERQCWVRKIPPARSEESTPFLTQELGFFLSKVQLYSIVGFRPVISRRVTHSTEGDERELKRKPGRVAEESAIYVGIMCGFEKKGIINYPSCQTTDWWRETLCKNNNFQIIHVFNL